MNIFVLVAIGVAGGVIGGMGMGGGTLLIPLLVLFADIGQHNAQSINLCVFIPMSVVALIIHFKNGLVDTKKALWVGVPSVATGVIASLLAQKTRPKMLSRFFGVFLLLLGLYQLTDLIIKKVRKRK